MKKMVFVVVLLVSAVSLSAQEFRPDFRPNDSFSLDEGRSSVNDETNTAAPLTSLDADLDVGNQDRVESKEDGQVDDYSKFEGGLVPMRFRYETASEGV